jgi:hypothetical protein
LFLVGSLLVAIQIDAVQTFVSKRLAAYLSGQLHTRVAIEGVSIRFVKSIVLRGFYVEDLHGDTLIYTGELTASIDNISTAFRELEVSRIVLKKGQFNLVHYRGEEHDNLHFITEYFSSADTTPAGPAWKVKVNDLSLRDFHFRHDVQDDTASTEGVDFSHLNVSGINGDFRNLSTLNDSLFSDIYGLSFREKSGFRVDEFSGQTMLSARGIRVNKLVIRTPHTDIHTDLEFSFDSFPDFDEFTSRIHWQSEFSNSTVSFTDIAYFAPELYGIDRALVMEGNFRGTVNNFKGKNVLLKWGKKSLFKGSVSMRGLPNIDETFMDVNADEIRTDRADIQWLPGIPFREKKNLYVPENLSALGTVSFKGKFTGFFSDFVAFGNVQTAIGSLSSDLNLKYNRSAATSEYSGHLTASDFDIGKIILNDDFGRVTFNVNLKGAGLRLDNISANLAGTIEQFEFRKYNYRNILVDGDIAKKLFNGSLAIKEQNVDLKFLGSIDYRGKLPDFNFTANIYDAKLDVLNLFDTKENTSLQTTLRSHFSGNSPDNFVGGVEVENTNLVRGKRLYHINAINIVATKDDRIRTFDIRSDNVDALFRGEFELAKLGDAVKEILPRYLPSVILPQKSFYSTQNFTFDIRVKNLSVFTETLFPSWDFAPNTILKGHFNTTANDLSLNIRSEWIRFNNFTFEDFRVKAAGINSEFNLDLNSGRISHNERTFIHLPALSAKAVNNKIDFVLHLADDDTSSSRAHVKGNLDFNSAADFTLHVDSAFLLAENKVWTLDPNNQVHYDSSRVNIRALTFSKGSESISVAGSIGKDSTDRLELQLHSFALDHLNAFLKSQKTVFGGITNGDVYLTGVYGRLQLETDLVISNLSINDDTLGNASLVTRYNNEQKIIASDIRVTKGTARIIDIRGNYYVNQPESNLDFTVKLSNLYLHPVERYIDDIMTELYGKVSADLKLTGTIDKPVFNGTVDLNKTSLIVNYLKTRYSFNTTVKVRENVFILDELTIYDANNNSATAKGKIIHDYFGNFRFDVELQAQKFQVLNTSLNDNSLYYGKANASGYARFFGPIDNMKMDISLSPDRGTVINIPLNTTEDLSSSNFISFIDRSRHGNDELLKTQVDLSGIRLNMNLDLNQEALINIIFDEKIGDVISGRGTGSLRLDINTAGNFNMYGTYTIEQGDYLFTLQNLINKKFNIDAGGRITWAGDPYEATVDLSAVYVVYTSTLYNLLQDSTYKRRLPVDCRLFLTNKLMNPIINYEINVRGLSPTEEGVVKTQINSEEQINKQMFGLLLFNQFLPASGTGQSIARVDAGAGAGASASELLSNQVSNWLGQISKDVNIGFNYRAKDTYTSEEVKLIFSKSLFNERLVIEGNVGYLSDQTYVNSNVVGDFYAEYKVSPDGRFRLKGFNRSNADNIINYSQAPYTQGFGIFYRQEFDTFNDLMVRWRLAHREEK